MATLRPLRARFASASYRSRLERNVLVHASECVCRHVSLRQARKSATVHAAAGVSSAGALDAVGRRVPTLEQRLRELTERRDALVLQREELLEQIRAANEEIGWLRAELRVLTPRRGFFAWLLS